MKRLIAVALATVLVASAFSQGTFTIRRPADGSRVRETVAIRIPKNSIPEGGYLGIVVNGKFLEAVMPTVSGEDYVYNLDTQGRKLPDGPTTIEAVLYMASDSNPVVLNRSSINVIVDNKTSIKIPDDGLSLRYKFQPGVTRSYTMKVNSTIAQVTQAQAQLGSRGRETVLEEELLRVMLATENAYGNEGLMRVQLLPYKGKDFIWATPSGQTDKTLIFADQMTPIWQRITNTGREVFSALPPYFPLEGTSGADRNPTEWLLEYPFPVLPAKGIKPGDTWQSAINIGSVSIPEMREKEKYFTAFPGRGVFEGVEWRRGIPCAKLSMTLTLGEKDLKSVGSLNGLPGEAQNLKIQQLVWFAVDRGAIVRQELNMSQESLVEVAGTGGGGGGGRAGGQPGPAGVSGAGGGGGGGGRAAAGFFFNHGSYFSPGTVNGAFRLMQDRGDDGGGDSGAAAGPGGSGQGSFGRGGAGTGGGSVGVKMIQRISQNLVFELE